ncbi:pyridoxamine 5'-phosphate oxidase family protein [Mycobacteroides saopaulense]|uniref:Pyridoxamine 5'-phosphate oxidase n=1 Tax=Mycobacteroides saopaulense TaxID=1578165 RepID=A0A1S1JUR6_9MYCO|nr:pyridoxamine 5'-phosphate oxidase family protein [Mycobacteroides saopaulense]ALR13124.1 pyridoxamine 5'-phosphate oxidase [Mycobacteroides saopaulense]OHT88544.1 pyridoxamine 5'-phosphate oxidase [Mycobacteroides saopaulense]OHU13362.1 pyridoxamine 5'-phosphate oxidase [Mycobacteroides saopaulense]ORB58700.1 pyridoxamine 5'-phosphate oxidase [Mycobacteroides saopaulense]
MGHVYEEIDDKLAHWLTEQPVFFVGTAPSGPDGHVNVSPKGMAGTFAVLGPKQVGYLDYFGSGAETIAHVRDNGRIVLMFCSFDKRCRIIRLHGRARVVQFNEAEYPKLRNNFSKTLEKGTRSIILVDVTRVADSCGYSVPLMDFVGHRDVYEKHVEKAPPEKLTFENALEKNGTSIDGLPAIR